MDVLNEIENLFKKLEAVPADIKEAALKRIVEKISNVDEKKRIELPSSRRRSSRKQKKEKEPTDKFIHESDYVVESVLTSRGRKAQRICYMPVKRQNTPEEHKTNSYTPENITTRIRKEQISLEDTCGTLNEDLVIDEKSGLNDDNISEVVNEESSKVNSGDSKLEPSSEESRLVIADPSFITVDLLEPHTFSSNEEMDQYFRNFRKDGKRKLKKTVQSGKESFRKEKQRPFSCYLCPFQTVSKFQLQNHLRKHIGIRSYKCYICKKIFCQSSALRVHLKRHCGQRDFPCDYGCNYRAYTKGDKLRHMTRHTGERRHQCQYCGKQFAKDSTLHEHLKSIHERSKKHMCPTCGFSTYRANNLRVHIRMRHRGEYNYLCPVCGVKVKKRAPFLDHMRSHTGERPYKCPLCESAFACVARLTVHRKSVHGPRKFNCKHCQKCFQTKFHLERHELTHTNQKPYDCPFCSYSCNAQGNVTKHVKSVHNKPDFSYRNYKTDQLADSDCNIRKSEWIEKGEMVTKEYLRDLSKKVGREVTLSELKECEAKKKKRSTENVEQVKKRRSRKQEHDYHSKMNPENEDQLEEEEVDEPNPVLLNVTQILPNSTTNVDGSVSGLPKARVLHEVPNHQSSNTQLFLQHDSEIGSLQSILSEKVKKESDLDTPLISEENIGLCMTEQIEIEEVPVHVVCHTACPQSANTSQGNEAPNSNNSEYIDNFNFVGVENDITSRKTIVVIINTEKH